MRLLSRKGDKLVLTPDEPPCEPYAILSHTWGKEEVTYDDVLANRVDKTGFRKIEFILDQAAIDGYQYVWVDTCCINKNDKHELGKAINRMWHWYKDAGVCYVYLEDVHTLSEIRHTKWFTRGWTLQELLAPHDVRFYSAEKVLLGSKDSLPDDILLACGIDTTRSLGQIPLAERLRWSLKRQTSEPEDLSYCMLGLLEVTLLFNYGEGADCARERILDAVEKEHGRRTIRDMREILTSHAKLTKKELTLDILLGHLEFKTMHKRWQTITREYPDTCTWALRHEDYKRWLNREIPMLWIKGKAGAGKSTIMKFLHSRSKTVNISFFFNARGEQLEHSTLGMHRSLLAQLLRKTTVGQQVLEYIKGQIRQGIPWEINILSLQSAMSFAIEHLQEPVRCYIDALDECDQREVREMIEFLEDNPGLAVCFASRHYPAITIKRGTELALEKQDYDDIALFVHGRLDVRGYPPEIAERVIEKANGIFFWAVLVVRLLNEDRSRGNVHQVDERLESHPRELNALIESIVTGQPGDELCQFRLCMFWLLFAMRTLRAEELFVAVVTGSRQGNRSSAKASLAPLVVPPTEQLERFVFSHSRGLAEVLANGTVQFVHESVRDYFLRHDGLKHLSPGDQPYLESLGHETIKMGCYTYVLEQDYSTLSRMSTNDLVEYGKRCPLLYYAIDFVIKHAEAAAEHIDQQDFLQNCDIAGVTSLLGKHVTVASDILGMGLIGVLVLNDASKLLLTAYAKTCHQSIQSRATPLLLAIEEDRSSAFQALLEYGCPHFTDDELHHLEDITRSKRSYKLGHKLFLHCRGTSMQDKLGAILLYNAAYAGLSDEVRSLLDSGIDVHAQSMQGYTAIQACFEANHCDTLEVLLDAGAALDDGFLAEACLCLRWKMIQLLARRSSSLDARADLGETALSKICKRVGSQDGLLAVETLLNHGANTEIQDNAQRTPLQSVCWLLRVAYNLNQSYIRPVDGGLLLCELVKLLLKHGANPLVTDTGGYTLASILDLDRPQRSLFAGWKEIAHLYIMQHALLLSDQLCVECFLPFGDTARMERINLLLDELRRQGKQELHLSCTEIISRVEKVSWDSRDLRRNDMPPERRCIGLCMQRTLEAVDSQ